MDEVKQPDGVICKDLIKAARGNIKTDIFIKNCRLINVFTGEIVPTSFAVKDGYIVGFGEYEAEVTLDLEGRWVCPGLIDGHVHIESSMLTPGEYARAVIPNGTTTVIIDPHEIANVCGTAGITYMLRASLDLPLRVYVMLPSCVPATNLETSGAKLEAEDLAPFIHHPRVLGLGELMNVPGVLNGDKGILEKIRLVDGKRIDGHAPCLSCHDLGAYKLAGVGSDHECITRKEALEKLRLGMRLMIREGSAAKNLKELLPIVTPENSRRCFFVSDDLHTGDLLEKGHIDYMVRTAIESGIDPVQAVQMATLNTAEWFGLTDVGAIAPGYRADFVILDDLKRFTVNEVYQGGIKIAENGLALFKRYPAVDHKVENTINVGNITRETLLKKLALPATGNKANVIGIVSNQIATDKLVLSPPVVGGCYTADPGQDLAKLAVVERHTASGRVGVGLVKGFGIKQGALVSSVAHDSHNIIALGVSDSDMAVGIEAVIAAGGGLAVVRANTVLGILPLPVVGLMSYSTAAEVDQKLKDLLSLARDLGVRNNFDPFMTLSFLALPVIPSLKITDFGLVDVEKQKVIPVSM